MDDLTAAYLRELLESIQVDQIDPPDKQTIWFTGNVDRKILNWLRRSMGLTGISIM